MFKLDSDAPEWNDWIIVTSRKADFAKHRQACYFCAPDKAKRESHVVDAVVINRRNNAVLLVSETGVNLVEVTRNKMVAEPKNDFQRQTMPSRKYEQWQIILNVVGNSLTRSPDPIMSAGSSVKAENVFAIGIEKYRTEGPTPDVTSIVQRA